MTSPQQTVSDEALQEQALHWFTRVQSGTMNEAEHQAFAEWLARSDRHASSYDAIEDFWQSPEFSIAAQRSDQQHSPLPDKGKDKQADKPQTITPVSVEPAPLTTRAKASQKNIFKRTSWAMAASILIMVIGFNSLKPHHNADYLTTTGEQQALTLDDGSQLTLNTDSAVNVTITNTTVRKVELLAGEVYLDVTKDPAGRPFQVVAGNTLIEVLGTQFSVKHEKNAVIVSGHSGRIAVSTGKLKPEIITVGERLGVSENRIEADTINIHQSFAWLDNRLAFSAQPLSKVIAELDRYYPGTILITNSKAANTLISGSYSLKNPRQVAAAISQIANAENVQLSPWLLLIY
ncbi:MAG: FecR family protein [Spongiibacteraceae bacterium]|nr:FecR family protein [Spongiibacteraceae bacterium]